MYQENKIYNEKLYVTNYGEIKYFYSQKENAYKNIQFKKCKYILLIHKKI